ncbi:prepilin-type N-terminal cleavage/methylation domain-containing protein [Hydrogenophaga sp. RWCD_12]|uniref:prepilin-type N-terminal cleavage/methylation domain-containing protein n=1 Tax=Hydrogenophaga sp. RWCD_12 TaxID=3391190 RepID=UPI0039855D23
MKPRSRGFTLLELLIVVSIVALATAGVSLSLRDTNATALDDEAVRLAAMFESARAQSRTSGVPVRWRSNAQGFEFQGITTSADARDSLARPRTWLNEQTRARVIQPPGASGLLLGPEPLIAAQQIELAQGDRRLVLGTDGLAPFAVVPAAAP